MKKVALIVAGGSGTRMGKTIPKQFVEIAGKPILMLTIEAFYKYDPKIDIILVLPEDQIESWKQLCEKFNFTINHTIATGGKTRFQSVKNGLAFVPKAGIIFIHDGVRPFVSARTLNNCFNCALENGNAIPVIQVSESLRKLEDGNSRAVNRDSYKLVQTPQTFQIDKIRKAYQQKEDSFFTDDASVLEANGEKIYLVEGNRENMKITYPEDIQLAETFVLKLFQ